MLEGGGNERGRKENKEGKSLPLQFRNCYHTCLDLVWFPIRRQQAFSSRDLPWSFLPPAVWALLSVTEPQHNTGVISQEGQALRRERLIRRNLRVILQFSFTRQESSLDSASHKTSITSPRLVWPTKRVKLWPFAYASCLISQDCSQLSFSLSPTRALRVTFPWPPVIPWPLRSLCPPRPHCPLNSPCCLNRNSLNYWFFCSWCFTVFPTAEHIRASKHLMNTHTQDENKQYAEQMWQAPPPFNTSLVHTFLYSQPKQIPLSEALVLWELCPCPWYFQVFYWRYASTTLQAAPRILGTSRHLSELTSLLLSYCISLTGLSLFLSDNHLCRLLSDAKVKVALEVGEGASELHCWFMWNPQPADSLGFCGCVQFSPVQSLSHVQSCCQTRVFILDMKLIL